MFKLNTIINLLFPVKCVGCKSYDSWLCQACKFKIPTETERVKVSLAYQGYLDEVYTASRYENRLIHDLLFAYKYGSVRSVNQVLGEIMVKGLTSVDFSKVDFICPVPLSAKKEWLRGFNQSADLANYLGKHLRLPVYSSLIKRNKNTKIQARLRPELRAGNVKNAFVLSKSVSLSHKTVLLIDDVVTTGATANECAKILKNNGAKKVYLATLCGGSA